MVERINIIGFDTVHGFRTAELVRGDLMEIEPRLDVMVVSAFRGSYFPTEGTVMRALLDRHGVDSMALSESPALDLRPSLGVWMSREQASGPAARFVYVEMRGSQRQVADMVDDLFAALLAIDGKGHGVGRVAMPLIGTGSQGLSAEEVTAVLVPAVKRYLEISPSTQNVMFVEKDGAKAHHVAEAMDRFLGRNKVSIPRQDVVDAIRSDIKHKLGACTALFNADGKALHDQWLRLLDSPQVTTQEFGILARKLTEHMVQLYGAPAGNLADRIRHLEKVGALAPWMCGYMHVLRQLGNEAAHSGQLGSHVVTGADLVAGLHCVQRLVDECSRKTVAAAS